MARFEEVAVVDLSRKRAVLFAKENFALAGFGFVDFAAGNFSRREFGLGHQPEGNQPQAHELDRLGFGFMPGVLLVHACRSAGASRQDRLF